MNETYEAPTVIEMGTLADLTQGSSDLVADSDLIGAGSL
ncbi:MAG: lasso RiPP family leader peptide-containing protein [Acidimicrobiales bacterium]